MGKEGQAKLRGTQTTATISLPYTQPITAPLPTSAPMAKGIVTGTKNAIFLWSVAQTTAETSTLNSTLLKLGKIVVNSEQFQ